MSASHPRVSREKDDEQKHGGTSLTEGDAVSVSVPAPKLSHDDAIAAIRHVVEVCTYRACDLVHFTLALRLLKRLESGDVFLITQKQYSDDRFQSLMDGIGVGNLATERAIEAGVLARVSPPIETEDAASNGTRGSVPSEALNENPQSKAEGR